MDNLFNDISYIDIYTRDYERLTTFYRDVIGMKPQSENETADTKWYGFETGNTTFAIEREENRDKYDLKFRRDNPVLIQFRAKTMEQLTQMNERLKKTV